MEGCREIVRWTPRKIEDAALTPNFPGAGSRNWRSALEQQSVLHWVCRLSMGVGLGTFLFEALTYNCIFLGRVLPAAGKQALAIPFGVLFNAAWAMALWSYIKAHLSDPGRVPDQWYEFVETSGTSLNVVPSSPGWHVGQATICRQCKQPRPERAHHCKVCGVCVLRYDHHCPWINNCVGFRNHKFFLLTGCYVWLTAILALVTSAPEVVELLAACWESAAPLPSDEAVLFFASSIVSLSIAALLSSLLFAHLPLAAENLTSVEVNYFADEDELPADLAENPFDQGSKAKNFAQLFGSYDATWFLPLEPRRPLCDGILFPSPAYELRSRCSRSRSPSLEGASGLSQSPSRCSSIAEKSSVDGLLDHQGPERADAEQLWRQRYLAGPTTRAARFQESSNKGPLELLMDWVKSNSACTKGSQQIDV
jgi:hypothetical protein